MTDWWIDGETGLPEEVGEKLRKKFSTSEEGLLVGETLLLGPDTVKPVRPLALGSSHDYFLDIVSANITIPSKAADKTDIVDADMERLAKLRLPVAKRYVRKGRAEVGFLAEEMPAEVLTSQGDIDVKALLAVLAAKVMALERVVYGGGGDELAPENQSEQAERVG
ncbi:MAG: hypothetical protein NZ570_06485 [Candidatus Caldarchaeum sp.]|nr:hypothetical protein [Candidatus Caldarchaeum sp.]